MNTPRLIGLTGYAGSGKSTVAEILTAHYGFVRISFASPMKRMLSSLGLTYEQLNGSAKSEPCDILSGKTPRFAMQTLGTEWGRQFIHPEFWTSLWLTEVKIVLGSRRSVVCDDLRFLNEAKVLSDNGGTVWRIERKGAKQGVHLSELEQNGIFVDKAISNNGTMAQLHFHVEDSLL